MALIMSRTFMGRFDGDLRDGMEWVDEGGSL